MAAQHYDTDINKEYVIRNNAAILKCVLPSYLSDYLTVVSWKIDDEEMTYNDQQYGSLRRRQLSPRFHSPHYELCHVLRDASSSLSKLKPRNFILSTAFSIKSREPVLRVGGSLGVHHQRQRGCDQMLDSVICHRLCESRSLAGKRRPGI